MAKRENMITAAKKLKQIGFAAAAAASLFAASCDFTAPEYVEGKPDPGQEKPAPEPEESLAGREISLTAEYIGRSNPTSGIDQLDRAAVIIFPENLKSLGKETVTGIITDKNTVVLKLPFKEKYQGFESLIFPKIERESGELIGKIGADRIGFEITGATEISRKDLKRIENEAGGWAMAMSDPRLKDGAICVPVFYPSNIIVSGLEIVDEYGGETIGQSRPRHIPGNGAIKSVRISWGNRNRNPGQYETPVAQLNVIIRTNFDIIANGIRGFKTNNGSIGRMRPGLGSDPDRGARADPVGAYPQAASGPNPNIAAVLPAEANSTPISLARAEKGKGR